MKCLTVKLALMSISIGCMGFANAQIQPDFQANVIFNLAANNTHYTNSHRYHRYPQYQRLAYSSEYRTNYVGQYLNRVNYNTNDLNTSSLPRRIAASGEKVFVFSPKLKRWAAYDREGFKVAAGVANGGADYCSELGRECRTPGGVFRIHNKGDSSCVSTKFPLGEGGAPMPYCMKFGAGFAIHGSPYISDRNGSHGCIRVHTPAAAWLSKYFVQHGTKVWILSY